MAHPNKYINVYIVIIYSILNERRQFVPITTCSNNTVHLFVTINRNDIL